MSVAAVGGVIFSNRVEAPYLIAGSCSTRNTPSLVPVNTNPPTTVLGNVNALLHGGHCLTLANGCHARHAPYGLAGHDVDRS